MIAHSELLGLHPEDVLLLQELIGTNEPETNFDIDSNETRDFRI